MQLGDRSVKTTTELKLQQFYVYSCLYPRLAPHLCNRWENASVKATTLPRTTFTEQDFSHAHKTPLPERAHSSLDVVEEHVGAAHDN
jgi:hypothetical protein